jgi:hypothetical protein
MIQTMLSLWRERHLGMIQGIFRLGDAIAKGAFGNPSNRRHVAVALQLEDGKEHGVYRKRGGERIFELINWHHPSS